MPEYAQNFFIKMVDSIADAVYVKDAEHKWMFLNNPALKLLQTSKEQIQNKNEFDFFPRKIAWEIYNNDREVFKTGKPSRTELLITINGESYYLAFHSSIFCPGENEKYIVCTVLDVTQRRKAENQLLEEKERFRLLSDYAGIGVITCDMNAKILYMNQRALDYIGIPNDEINQASLKELINPSDRFLALMEKQRRNPDRKVVESFECSIKHASEILSPVHLQITPVFQNGQFMEMLIIIKEKKNN